MNTPLPATCDCTCDGVIGVVTCPPPALPVPDTPSRPRHRRNVPPGQMPRRGRPLRDGRGGDVTPDRPTLGGPRTTTIPPKWLPEGNPWDFDENDPGNPADPSPHVPVPGPSPRHVTNTSPRGINVVGNELRRASREGGYLDTPNPGPRGPRLTRPKLIRDWKYEVNPNNPTGPEGQPGDTVNNQ